jgi:TolB protein
VAPGTGILFYSVRNDNADIYRVAPTGGALTRMTTEPQPDSGAAWSPDGRRIAFESRRPATDLPAGFAQIWVMDADGTNARAVTRDSSNNTHPTWSPNGASIAFESDRSGTPQIYVIGADGSGERRLTSLTGGATLPAWSSRGEIAVVRKLPSGTEIWAVKATNGSGARRIVTGTAAYPAWSPDGRSVAFASTRFGGKYQVFLATAAGGNVRRITSDPAQAIFPAWSRDGMRIAYEGTVAGRRGIFVVRVTGGSPTRVVGDGFDNRRPNWR